MTGRHFFASCVATVGLFVSSSALAQPPEGMPPMPKPGPEHAVLQADAGVWDATVEVFMAPGQPPSVSKGVETNTMVGGMFLVSDFKSEMMGAPFMGHGTSTWDSGKKKYVSTWIDTMSTGHSLAEATYDPATRTMTGFMEGPDMTGTMMRMRAVTQNKPDGTRVFSLYNVGPGGQETLSMRITYVRRK